MLKKKEKRLHNNEIHIENQQKHPKKLEKKIVMLSQGLR